MINLTPIFLSQYHNFSRGFPDGINTIINVPNLTKVGKKITVSYKDTAYLKNPVFPVELYEYRRGKNMGQLVGNIPPLMYMFFCLELLIKPNYA